jgi:hypothetical protein
MPVTVAQLVEQSMYDPKSVCLSPAFAVITRKIAEIYKVNKVQGQWQ